MNRLRLLLEEGLISGEPIETYDSAFIAVKGLAAQGHGHLDVAARRKEGHS